jgi:hypothetical protein
VPIGRSTDPLEPNHQSGHPGLGAVWARELEQSAKAFEFDREAWEAATALLATKSRRQCIFDQCRPPSLTAFFEITNDEDRTCGILTEGGHTNCKISVFSIPRVDLKGRNLSAQKEEFIRGYMRVLPWFQMRVNFDAEYMIKSVHCFSSAAKERMEVEINKAAGTMDLTTAELFVGQVAALWSYLGTPGVAPIGRLSHAKAGERGSAGSSRWRQSIPITSLPSTYRAKSARPIMMPRSHIIYRGSQLILVGGFTTLSHIPASSTRHRQARLSYFVGSLLGGTGAFTSAPIIGAIRSLASLRRSGKLGRHEQKLDEVEISFLATSYCAFEKLR